MRYMLAIIGEESDWGDVSPEEMKAGMARWYEYSAALEEAGAHVAGEGLQPSATATTIKIVRDGAPVTVDGPFAETKEQLGGFYLIDVDDLDAALEWARKVPAQPGSSIEVRPVLEFDASAGAEQPAGAEAVS